MLAPPLEEFKGNKVTLLAVVIVVGGFAGLIGKGLASPPDPVTDRSLIIYGVVVLALLALFAGWILSVRVSLHPDGISYQSWFGSKELRLDELQRVYYSSVKRSVNFIPIGTYYKFKLIDSSGKKLSFGNRVERPGVLGPKLVQHTHPALLNNAVRLLQSGQEVDFGKIRVTRDRGVKVTRPAWLGLRVRTEEIPWDQVSGYRIDQGHFYIFRQGQKTTTGPLVSQVPNAFVLLALLDGIYRQAAPASA